MAAPDLVQSVLEAQEKKNLERVDMLVTNAIKQLKMFRFKPDQTTCLSLTYLARTSPSLFRQSTVIKDTLKSLLRRDNGPTNIKGKNDIVLPVLAANIMLACCDSPEVKTLILNKIDQWLSASNGQKAGELVQHLLATICMKCHGDQQAIGTLIEMRQHWLQYLEDNFDLYGPIPVDLCVSIRKLLHSETNCDCLIGHLNFLLKHDKDIDGLGYEIGKFITERPMSLSDMFKQGTELDKTILKVFNKIVRIDGDNIKPDPAITYLYIQVPDNARTVTINKITLKAILNLISSIDGTEFEELLEGWLVTKKSGRKRLSNIYEDSALTKPYDLNDKLRRKLIQSNNDLLVELGLRDANASQLISLIQLFGLPLPTIEKITERLEAIEDTESLRSKIDDPSYFNNLLDLYHEMGSKNSRELHKRITNSVA